MGSPTCGFLRPGDGQRSALIPGIPERRVEELQRVLAQPEHLQAVWLFGSRAMGRHRSGSDIDLCLEGPELTHGDRLRLMTAIDELLLPWRVDLVLRHECPADLEAHVQRVGRCIWRGSPPEPHTDSAGTSPEATSTDDTPGTIR